MILQRICDRVDFDLDDIQSGLSRTRPPFAVPSFVSILSELSALAHLLLMQNICVPPHRHASVRVVLECEQLGENFEVSIEAFQQI